MAQLAPSLLWITLHDIDIAHSGAYSLYLDGIQRSDRLCADIWSAIQTSPEYKDRTTLFILPDFGRDADTQSRRQRLPASPHRRRALPHHLDARARPRHPPERHRRSTCRLARPGPYPRRYPRLLAYSRPGPSRFARSSSHAHARQLRRLPPASQNARLRQPCRS